MLRLSELSRCFQGITPSVIATCSKDGEPNVTYLSQVFYVDDRHVALSRQFLNKTAQNVSENPYAAVQFYDPLTFDGYEADLRFDHAETTGPLFEAMSTRIQAIASQCGMSGVFKLLSSDVYEVLSLRKIEGFVQGPPPPPSGAVGLRNELRALQVISSRLNQARDLDHLLSSLLQAIEEELGFQHAMVLLADESGEKLFTIASAGYGQSGVGSEVRVGQGIVGAVAEQRKILRFGRIGHEMRYGRAIRGEVATASAGVELAPEIPLPGLPDAQSHLGIPLLVKDRLVGVLAVESRALGAFGEWHEQFLDIIGNQAAIAIDTMSADEGEPVPSVAPAKLEAPASSRRVRAFRYYKGDDCVFVDGEYLVRNVPGRIFWRILKSHTDERRVDFTNRELRLDTTLGLPAIKDNLESRLILLRKRLEQKCPDVRIPSTGRGHFRLELDCEVVLEEKD